MVELTILEITPNAIALLASTDTDSENIERTIFQCCSCHLYYCWQDLVEQNSETDLCPRCGSQDIGTNAEDLLTTIAPAYQNDAIPQSH